MNKTEQQAKKAFIVVAIVGLTIIGLNIIDEIKDYNNKQQQIKKYSYCESNSNYPNYGYTVTQTEIEEFCYYDNGIERGKRRFMDNDYDRLNLKRKTK